jgi:hypothetical protein
VRDPRALDHLTEEVAMRKFLLALATVVLSVGMAAGPAWSATGGTERPVKLWGSSTINVVTGEGHGSIVGTHVGWGDSDVQFMSPTTSRFVTTTANGDQIFGTSTLTSGTTGVDVITGGTGRFEGATGHTTTTSVVTPTHDPDVVMTTSYIEGWISY